MRSYRPLSRYEKGKVAWEIPYEELKFDKEVIRFFFWSVSLIERLTRLCE